jgi:hypothetical protein
MDSRVGDALCGPVVVLAKPLMRMHHISRGEAKLVQSVRHSVGFVLPT